MSRFVLPLGVLSVVALAVSSGCHPQQPFYLHEDGDLSHYIGVDTDLEEPDLQVESLAEVTGAKRPFSVLNSEGLQVTDLTLEDAVRWTLANSKVMRTIGGRVLGAPETLTRSVDMVSTVYDPAIVETNPRSGIAAAESIFDAQLSSSLFYEKLDTPRNTFPGLQAFFRGVNQQDTATFQVQLQKTNATGGTMSLTHNVFFDDQNTPRAFGNDWNTNLEASFSQPLLQGAGIAYNRIAGPGAIPGFDNGVMVARINTDMALADFEAGVRNLVWDVEVAYWELYFAYRNLHAMAQGRDAALETWRKVYQKFVVGAKGGELSEVSQARAQYYLFESELQVAFDAVYATERNLRYVMGLAPTDDRLFRPVDEPTTAPWPFEYADIHAEALTRSVELRRQRWNVKLRQLKLISAKNYLLPRLDLTGTYRFLGMGDDLLEASGGSGDRLTLGSNAYQSMTSGRYQEGEIGITLDVPLGFRKEMAGVKHAELNLLREKARLRDLELEVVHQLQSAVAELDRNLSLTRINWQRRVATAKQLEAVEAQWKIGVRGSGGPNVMIDLLLESQRQRVQAESAYYRALIDYNKAIGQVHFRKGTLLEYDGVYLAEGPWPGKAYFDARRRARARDASHYLDYGFTRPKVVSAGPTGQTANPGLSPFEEMEGSPVPDSFDLLELPIESAPDGAGVPEAPVPDDQAALDRGKGGGSQAGSAVKRAGYREPASDGKMTGSGPAKVASTAAGRSPIRSSKPKSPGTWNASGTTSSVAENGWHASKRAGIQP